MAILRRVGGGRAFCSVGALLALVVVAGFGLHGAWAADPPKLVWHECAARVVQVQSPTRVVLNRGRVDGLKVADRLRSTRWAPTARSISRCGWPAVG